MDIENTTVSPRILVVDDDKVTRLTLSKILLNAGYQVEEAENGQIGFAKFTQTPPDLILMDALMPVMDGYATIKAIRNYSQAANIPIIMLTALDDADSIDQAFEVGATDFATKPIQWILLIKRIKYALQTARIENNLRSSQKWLNYAMKIAKLGYWEWDLTTDAVTGSISAFELLSVPYKASMPLQQFISNIIPKDQPLVQQAITEAQQGGSQIQVSFRVAHPDQHLSHIDCLGETIFDKAGQLVKITGSFQDISRLHKAESLIDYQSSHDKLTDLPNRSLFNQTLTEWVAKEKTDGVSAVIVLDIDRFKGINDNLGQDKGDLLLKTVAQRLQKVTREDDFVARLGSDEFAIIVKHAQDIEEFQLSLYRIFNDLSKPYMIENSEIHNSFSLGVAIVHQDGKTSNHLLANANVARAEAKKQGGNQFQLYQKDMNIEAKAKLTLENDLYKALERGEIEVYYQPQIDAKTLQPYGAEALVRWNHSTEGIISPVIFIPMAESTGLIVEIGRYIIQQAVEKTQRWHEMGFTNFHIGINLSGRQFSSDNLMDVIQNVLQHTPIAAKYLDLEITESLAMSNADHNITVLNGLKALGVSLSIDDFGTGYSSLSYLHSFPVDTIKIDQSFVFNLNTDAGKAIVNTIIVMAKSLNLHVVAEGIEEQFHIDFLQSKGCDIFQGYFFGKPMQAHHFEEFLLNYNKD